MVDEHGPERYPLWVEERDGGVVAWLSVSQYYRQSAYDATGEVSVYVAPGHQRSGIARRLLTLALETAPGLGLKTLVGYVWAHNEASLRLFETQGFERWGRLPRIAEVDGRAVDTVILEDTSKTGATHEPAAKARRHRARRQRTCRGQDRRDGEQRDVTPPRARCDGGWATEGYPVDNDGDEDAGKRDGVIPLPNGTVFRVIQYDPGVAPRMHRTDSIDYCVVMSGEIDMRLDDETVHLKAGDVVVQRGTIHDWVNNGTEPCVIAFVLIDARPAGNRRRRARATAARRAAWCRRFRTRRWLAPPASCGHVRA